MNPNSDKSSSGSKYTTAVEKKGAHLVSLVKLDELLRREKNEFNVQFLLEVHAGRQVSIQVPTSRGAGGGDGPAGELVRAGFLVGGTFFFPFVFQHFCSAFCCVQPPLTNIACILIES